MFLKTWDTLQSHRETILALQRVVLRYHDSVFANFLIAEQASGFCRIEMEDALLRSIQRG